MGISRSLKEKIKNYSNNEVDRMIRMGWEDRTTFEDISKQFSISANDFVRFMRSQLTPSEFSRWRKRIHDQGRLKNETQRGFKTTRFKCSRQSIDGLTKGWK